MAYKSAQLIIPTIESYASGSLISKPQDDSQATHTEHIDKAHGRINWSQSSQQIYNQFRAFYPWPGVWTTWNGKLVKIIDCSPANFKMHRVYSDACFARSEPRPKRRGRFLQNRASVRGRGCGVRGIISFTNKNPPIGGEEGN